MQASRRSRSEQDAVRLFRERESVDRPPSLLPPALGCSDTLCGERPPTSVGGCDRIEAATAAPSHLARSGLASALSLFVTALTPPRARALLRPRPPPPSLALGRARPRVNFRSFPDSDTSPMRIDAAAAAPQPHRDAGSFKDKGSKRQSIHKARWLLATYEDFSSALYITQHISLSCYYSCMGKEGLTQGTSLVIRSL